MHKDWVKMAETLNGTMGDLRKGIPDVMKGFGQTAGAANAEGQALDPKTKELIALAIGVAIRCDGCICFHAKAAVDKGATREEVEQTLGVSVYMGGGPSAVYGSQALEAFDQFKAAAGK